MNTAQEDKNAKQNNAFKRTFTSSSVQVANYINEQFSPINSTITLIGGCLGGNSNGGSVTSTQNRINSMTRQNTQMTQERSSQNNTCHSSDAINRNSQNKIKYHQNESINKQDLLSQTSKEFIWRQNHLAQHKKVQSQNKEIKLSSIASPSQRQIQLGYHSQQSSCSQKNDDINLEQSQISPSQLHRIDRRKQLSNHELRVEDKQRMEQTQKIVNKYNYFYGGGGQSYDYSRWNVTQYNQIANNSQQIQQSNQLQQKDHQHQKTKSTINIINISNDKSNYTHTSTRSVESLQFLQKNNFSKKILQNYQSTQLNQNRNKTPTQQQVEQYKLSIATQKSNKVFGTPQTNRASPTLAPIGSERVFSSSFSNKIFPPLDEESKQYNTLQINHSDRHSRVGKMIRFNNGNVNNKINVKQYSNFLPLDENQFRKIVNDRLNREYTKTTGASYNQQTDLQQSQLVDNQQTQYSEYPTKQNTQQTLQNTIASSQQIEQPPLIPLGLIDNVETTQTTNSNTETKTKIRFKTETCDTSPSKAQDTKKQTLFDNSVSKNRVNHMSQFSLNNIKQKQVQQEKDQLKDIQLNSVESRESDITLTQQTFRTENKNKLTQQSLQQQILIPQRSNSGTRQNQQNNQKSQNTTNTQQQQQSPLKKKKEQLIMITPQQIQQIFDSEQKMKRIEQQKIVYDLVKQVEENPLDKVNSQQKDNNQAHVNDMQKKQKNKNSLINDIIKSKSKQSIAVIQDILRMNNITEIPVNRMDSPIERIEPKHKSNERAIANHLKQKNKNQQGFSQTLYDLKRTNTQFIHTIQSMMQQNDSNKSRNSFRMMQYQDIINENANAINNYNDSLSPRDKNPIQIERINENKYFQQITKDQISQKKNGYLLRKALREALIYIHKLKISPKELIQNIVFSTKPFQKKRSHELINAAKKGDYQSAKDLVIDSKFLVYDFDFVYMTALHWACKRGHIQVAQLLIQSGSDVDAQDLIGRTPLYFAVVNHDIDIANLLLLNQASPWSTSEYNINELIQDNPKLISLLSRFRKLDIVAKMCKADQRQEFWEKQSHFIDQNTQR